MVYGIFTIDNKNAFLIVFFVVLWKRDKIGNTYITVPKNKKARDLLMRAPSFVTQQQLDDVHIQIKKD